MDPKLNDKKILNQLNSASFIKQVVGSCEIDHNSKPADKYSELFKNNSKFQQKPSAGKVAVTLGSNSSMVNNDFKNPQENSSCHMTNKNYNQSGNFPINNQLSQDLFYGRQGNDIISNNNDHDTMESPLQRTCEQINEHEQSIRNDSDQETQIQWTSLERDHQAQALNSGGGNQNYSKFHPASIVTTLKNDQDFDQQNTIQVIDNEIELSDNQNIQQNSKQHDTIDDETVQHQKSRNNFLFSSVEENDQSELMAPPRRLNRQNKMRAARSSSRTGGIVKHTHKRQNALVISNVTAQDSAQKTSECHNQINKQSSKNSQINQSFFLKNHNTTQSVLETQNNPQNSDKIIQNLQENEFGNKHEAINNFISTNIDIPKSSLQNTIEQIDDKNTEIQNEQFLRCEPHLQKSDTKTFKRNLNDNDQNEDKNNFQDKIIESEPLTERFIKEDNISKMCNSVRNNQRQNLQNQLELDNEHNRIISISPQTRRKEPNQKQCRSQQRAANTSNNKQIIVDPFYNKTDQNMFVIDLQETVRQKCFSKICNDLKLQESLSNNGLEESANNDEVLSNQDENQMDSKSVAIQEDIDDSYLEQNLYDLALEASLKGPLEFSLDGFFEGLDLPVENDERHVNLRITNTSKQLQMRKKLSQIKEKQVEKTQIGLDDQKIKLEQQRSEMNNSITFHKLLLKQNDSINHSKSPLDDLAHQQVSVTSSKAQSKNRDYKAQNILLRAPELGPCNDNKSKKRDEISSQIQIRNHGQAHALLQQHLMDTTKQAVISSNPMSNRQINIVNKASDIKNTYNKALATKNFHQHRILVKKTPQCSNNGAGGVISAKNQVEQINIRPQRKFSRNKIDSQREDKLGSTTDNFGQHENLTLYPNTRLNTGGSTPKTAMNRNNSGFRKQQKILINKGDMLTIDSQKKMLIHLIQKQQNYVIDPSTTTNQIPITAKQSESSLQRNPTAEPTNEFGLLCGPQEQKQIEQIGTIGITIQGGSELKSQSQLRILNLNQKQLNQNRLKQSRNQLVPSYQRSNTNKTNGFKNQQQSQQLKQIYNSKEEDLTRLKLHNQQIQVPKVQLSSQPIQIHNGSSQKQLPQQSYTAQQVVLNNQVMQRRIPSGTRRQPDNSSIKQSYNASSSLNNSNNQGQPPLQLGHDNQIQKQQNQILSQQVLRNRQKLSPILKNSLTYKQSSKGQQQCNVSAQQLNNQKLPMQLCSSSYQNDELVLESRKTKEGSLQPIKCVPLCSSPQQANNSSKGKKIPQLKGQPPRIN